MGNEYGEELFLSMRHSTRNANQYVLQLLTLVRKYTANTVKIMKLFRFVLP